MRVLVTGGAGFIGSHVVRELLRLGHQPMVLDNLSRGSRDNLMVDVPFIEGDVLEPSAWVKEVKTVDAVIHLAGQISVALSETNPAEDVRVNVLGTVSALEGASHLGCRDFRFASSAAVYGDVAQLPIVEDQLGQPLSYYGLDKWMAEGYVRFQCDKHGMSGVILRLANVYGPRQSTQGEGGVVAVFSEALAQGRMPIIDGDGQQTRDFIAAFDVARAFCHRLGDLRASGTYNIATNTSTSIERIWTLLAQEMGIDPQHVGHGPNRPGDIRHSRLSTDRALAWGFQATTPLAEGLAKTLQYFQQKVRLG